MTIEEGSKYVLRNASTLLSDRYLTADSSALHVIAQPGNIQSLSQQWIFRKDDDGYWNIESARWRGSFLAMNDQDELILRRTRPDSWKAWGTTGYARRYTFFNLEMEYENSDYVISLTTKQSGGRVSVVERVAKRNEYWDLGLVS